MAVEVKCHLFFHGSETNIPTYFLFMLNTAYDVSKIYLLVNSDTLCLSTAYGQSPPLKTFPQATYQKINFSLDHFLQLYFKIYKLFFIVLKNWDTKYKTSILIIFLNEQLKAPKTHTEYITFFTV